MPRVPDRARVLLGAAAGIAFLASVAIAAVGVASAETWREFPRGVWIDEPEGWQRLLTALTPETLVVDLAALFIVAITGPLARAMRVLACAVAMLAGLTVVGAVAYGPAGPLSVSDWLPTVVLGLDVVALTIVLLAVDRVAGPAVARSASQS